jgi:hypothetical protein
MKVNLTDEEVKQTKTQFSAYGEIQDEKKALADAEKDCKEKVADIIEGKLGDAGKLLKLMLKISSGAEDDLGELSLISDRIRGLKEEEEDVED